MNKKIKFDYMKYKHEIIKLIYEKAQNNSDAQATFSLHEINPRLHIESEDVQAFMNWLINEEIVIKFKQCGVDLFECVANDKFLQAELNRRIKGKEEQR